MFLSTLASQSSGLFALLFLCKSFAWTVMNVFPLLSLPFALMPSGIAFYITLFYYCHLSVLPFSHTHTLSLCSFIYPLFISIFLNRISSLVISVPVYFSFYINDSLFLSVAFICLSFVLSPISIFHPVSYICLSFFLSPLSVTVTDFFAYPIEG